LQPSATENVLVWGAERIGDVVMTIAAMRLLREHLPNAHITYETTHYARDLVDLAGIADKVTCHVLRGGPRNIFKWWGLRRRVRKGFYDLVFVFGKPSRFTARVAPLTLADGVVERRPDMHRTEAGVRQVVDALTLPVDTPAPDVMLDVPEPDGLIDTARGAGLDMGKPFVAVHPGCHRVRRGHLDGERGNKTWPERNYLPLLEQLTEQHPELTFAFLGSGSERRWVEREILVELPRGVGTVNLCGLTPVATLLGVLRRARLLVAIDSGVAHLATTTGTPVVAMFGPTDESWTGPYDTSGRVRIVRAPGTTPEDPHSMALLNVDQVRDAVNEQLDGFAKRQGGQIAEDAD
jgi:ADP-heptose:LPS heptosyltransferase